MRLTWPILDSPRLLLRPLSGNDVSDVYAFASNPDVAALSGWPPHGTREDTRRFLDEMTGRYAAGLAAPWAIVLKDSSTVVGTVGFVEYVAEHRRATISGVLAADHWGKGLMTEAAMLVMYFAFRTLRLARVAAVCRPEHDAAIRVAEKLGMLREGYLRDYLVIQSKPVSVAVYSILRADFLEMLQHQVAREAPPVTSPEVWPFRAGEVTDDRRRRAPGTFPDHLDYPDDHG